MERGQGRGWVSGEGRDLGDEWGGTRTVGEERQFLEEGWGGARGEVVGGVTALDSPPPPLTLPSPRGSEVRVLLFNSTGDRDSAALLKVLQVRNWLGYGQQGGQLGCWL